LEDHLEFITVRQCVNMRRESDKQHSAERCAVCFCYSTAYRRYEVPLECRVRRVVIARGFVSRRERNNHPRCLHDERTRGGRGWKSARGLKTSAATERLELVTPRPKV